MAAPLGVTQSWRLWRHCCCRYGWFPLLIVPIVTLGCLLSVYSSMGCRFVEIDIGFVPVNDGWDSSSAKDIGLYFQYDDSVESNNQFRETFHTGCTWNSASFVKNFISDDRTFKMTRVMALISCVSSAVAMIIAWLFVLTPIPITCFWAIVLVPSTMIAFISEGSKFLVFDTAICRNAVWYRGNSLVPEKADSCQFGETAWFACASAVLHFWALVCVCIRAPERRILKQEYGRKDVDITNKNNSHSYDDDVEGGGRNKSGKADRGDRGSDLDDEATSPKSNTKKSIQQYKDNNEMEDAHVKAVKAQNEMEEKMQRTCPTNVPGGVNMTVPTSSSTAQVQVPKGDPGISPMDCLIESFEVATDLSTMICSTPHAIEVEDGTIEAKVYNTSEVAIAKSTEEPDRTTTEEDPVLSARRTEEPEEQTTAMEPEPEDGSGINDKLTQSASVKEGSEIATSILP